LKNDVLTNQLSTVHQLLFFLITHTHPFYGPFSRTTQVNGARRNLLLHFMVQGKITEEDSPTILMDATPSRLISSLNPIFMPDAISAATLPLYPGLGQASNMLACIPSGVVIYFSYLHILKKFSNPE